MPPPTTALPSRLLLICSIGNPAPYQNTLHSAGHTLLSALRTHLAYPPFHPSPPPTRALISRGEDALLWQSPTLMNVSGPAVLTAWRAFLADADRYRERGRERARLVVLHDELELGLGEVRVRGGGGSVRGHNGLKSVRGSLAGAGGEWWRIGVGIGRPESRERGDVSGFVLREMRGGERERIVGAVGEVVGELVKLRDG